MCDRLEFHFLELGKVDPNKPIEKMSQIERLAVYLRYADDENYKDSVQEICESEEGIVMAENLYRTVTKEEREAAWAECRMMYQHDMASMREDARKAGLAEGLAEGRAEGRTQGLAEGHAEGHAEGLAKGEAIGLEKGAAQKQREIAKNLKDLGVGTDEIIKATGLSAEEVEEL